MFERCDAVVQGVLSWWESVLLGYYFTRSLNDWEEEIILNLLSLLADLNVDVHLEGEDKIVWSLDSSGIFSIKSRCVKIVGSNCPDFLAKAIRKFKGPTKVCFLAWAASKGKVPTEVMLKN